MTNTIKTEGGVPAYNKVNFFMLIKGGASEFIEFVETIFEAHENKRPGRPTKMEH